MFQSKIVVNKVRISILSIWLSCYWCRLRFYYRRTHINNVAWQSVRARSIPITLRNSLLLAHVLRTRYNRVIERDRIKKEHPEIIKRWAYLWLVTTYDKFISLHVPLLNCVRFYFVRVCRIFYFVHFCGFVYFLVVSRFSLCFMLNLLYIHCSKVQFFIRSVPLPCGTRWNVWLWQMRHAYKNINVDEHKKRNHSAFYGSKRNNL